MRHVIFLDNKISLTAFEEWKQKDTEFWQQFLDIRPAYWVIPYDFTDYPIELDGDGDVRPQNKLLHQFADRVHQRYSSHGTDYVCLFIHEDNWKSGRIWGTAWAYVHQEYLFTYNRWDRDNSINSFNTIYHEKLHPMDALIKVETGTDINVLVEEWLLRSFAFKPSVTSYIERNGFNWDRDMVHGNLPELFDYIGARGAGNNSAVLPIIAPYLQEALVKRQQRHEDFLLKRRSLYERLIQAMIYYIQRLLNRKHGVAK